MASPHPSPFLYQFHEQDHVQQSETNSQLSKNSSQQVSNHSQQFTKYKVIQKKGQGSFGKAYLVFKQNQPSSKFILKKMNLTNQSSSSKKSMFQQIKLMQNLNHLYIVRYIQSYVQGKCVCIVMDYAQNGDLQKFIDKKQKANQSIDQELIIKWLVQLSLGLKYIHQRKVLHRDLKADNVFLTKDNQIKIGDFGVSKIMQGTFDLAKTKIGTPHIMAPQIFQNMKYNQKSDIWSLGCLIYKLMTFKYPFQSKNIMAMIAKHQNKTIDPIQQFTTHQYSEELKQLTYQMLSFNLNDRPSVHKTLDTDLVKKNTNKVLSDSIRLHQQKAKNSFGIDNEINTKNELIRSYDRSEKNLSQLSGRVSGKQLMYKSKQITVSSVPSLHTPVSRQKRNLKESQHCLMSSKSKSKNNQNSIYNLTPTKHNRAENLKVVEMKLNYPILVEENRLMKQQKENLNQEKEQFYQQVLKTIQAHKTNKKTSKQDALMEIRNLILHCKYK